MWNIWKYCWRSESGEVMKLDSGDAVKEKSESTEYRKNLCMLLNKLCSILKSEVNIQQIVTFIISDKVSIFIQNHWPPAPPWLWSGGSVPRWIITCLNWTVVNHFKCESWENKELKNPETVLEGRTLHYPCPLRSESNDIPTGDYLGNVNWFKLFRHSVSKLRELCQFLN